MNGGAGGRARVVLVDFDWPDADLVPDLLRDPAYRVCLVAGAHADDPGVRVAELIGIPRTLELHEVARERFDLAIVGASSRRRADLFAWFGDRGTPVAPSDAFREAGPVGNARPAPAAHGEMPASAQVEAWIESAIPDLTPEPGAAAVAAHAPPLPAESDVVSAPAPDDRAGLERMLARLAQQTGAVRVALMVPRGAAFAYAAALGGEDPLLRALGELALRVDAPQVVARMEGSRPGRVAGAWPFRTREHHAVLLAAGLVAGTAVTAWERAAIALHRTWERACAGNVTPPAAPAALWVTPRAFGDQVARAVERHRRDGRRCAVHRVHLAGAGVAFDSLLREAAPALRAVDCACSTGAATALLLICGSGGAFAPLRTELERVARGHAAPASRLAEERIELATPEDADVFAAAVAGWLAGAR